MKKKLKDILGSEDIVRNEPAMQLLADGQSQYGRLILTRTRLIFAKNVVKSDGFKHYQIREQMLEPLADIDLDTINTVTRETYVVDENILSVTYLQYENAKFSVIHFSEWDEDIQRTRMTPDIPGDPNRSAEAA